MGNNNYTSWLWRMMSGDESMRTQPTMEEKTIGYGGEERGKTGKMMRGRKDRYPVFFFFIFSFSFGWLRFNLFHPTALKKTRHVTSPSTVDFSIDN